MVGRQPSSLKKYFKLPWLLVEVMALGMVLTVSGFTYIAIQETHASFCASCHTQPESTFYRRSRAARAIDLSSYHIARKVSCVDCHSGPGIVGRIQAELRGAHNALAWHTGSATQPAKPIAPIADANCLKCHQAVIRPGYTPKHSIGIGGGGSEGEGGDDAKANHWHENIARWRDTTANAGMCVSCHSGHVTDGTARNGFQNLQTTRKVCGACHKVLRREGGG